MLTRCEDGVYKVSNMTTLQARANLAHFLSFLARKPLIGQSRLNIENNLTPCNSVNASTANIGRYSIVFHYVIQFVTCARYPRKGTNFSSKHDWPLCGSTWQV